MTFFFYFWTINVLYILYSGTTFHGNEGNATGGRASAHGLLRQVALAVLVPVWFHFCLCPRCTGGRLSSFHGSGCLQNVRRTQPTNTTTKARFKQSHLTVWLPPSHSFSAHLCTCLPVCPPVRCRNSPNWLTQPKNQSGALEQLYLSVVIGQSTRTSASAGPRAMKYIPRQHCGGEAT